VIIAIDGSTLAATDWDSSTLRIENVLTQQIDTCSVTVLDYAVTEWDEIIVYRANGTTREFAGYVTEIGKRAPHEHTFRDLTCQDYTVLLATVRVNDVYADMTDAAIIQSAFTEYLPEITTADYVKTGATIDKIVCERITLLDLMQRICDQSGYDFYVDYDKKLHYFANEENAAPFGLSTDFDTGFDTSVPYSLRSHKTAAQEIINKILVEGGWYLSSNTYFYIEANAEIKEFNLTRALHAPSGESSTKVWQNDGTKDVPVWTAKAVGTLYLHEFTDGYDVLYGYAEQVLQFNVAPPAVENAIRVQGRYEIPILVRRRSQASYDLYGRWLEDVITDTKIETVQQAKDRAQAVFAKHAMAKTRGTLQTYWYGLRSGQLVSLYHDKLNIDANYLIHRVIAEPRAPDRSRTREGGHITYTVEYGEYNPDLLDLVLKLKREYKAREARDDEVLNELLEMSETITLTESYSYTAEDDWRWAPYSGTPGSEARWDLFSWERENWWTVGDSTVGGADVIN